MNEDVVVTCQRPVSSTITSREISAVSVTNRRLEKFSFQTGRDRTNLNERKPLLMISLFRRFILSPSPSLPPLRSAALMDSRANHSSQRLLSLAQQLRLYRPPPSSDESEEQRIEEAAGKVVSQVGIPESQTPIAKDTESFRPKRAAVLICLFEGDGGDLRVILTKRSSRLSTHSG